MAELRIHKVTKIEVKKVNKGDSYICRDLIIHTRIDLFLDNASASKLVYSKEMY